MNSLPRRLRPRGVGGSDSSVYSYLLTWHFFKTASDYFLSVMKVPLQDLAVVIDMIVVVGTLLALRSLSVGWVTT